MKKLRSKGYVVDLTKRPMMSAKLSFLIILIELRANLFVLLVPSKYRRRVRKMLFHKNG